MKVITDEKRYVIYIEKDEILSLTELEDGKVVIEGIKKLKN